MKRIKNKKKRKPDRWVPFERAVVWHNPHTGAVTDIPDNVVSLRNHKYQVLMTRVEDAEPFGEIIWLSIKRNDRKPIHDWRDLQRIKNEIVGEEIEAVEIYPAESRLLDTSNQFHIWCFPSGYRLPFGYTTRLVIENPGDGAVQRPFAERPKELDDGTDFEEKEKAGLPRLMPGRWAE